MLNALVNGTVNFKDFSRPMRVFPVLFKANLIFKDFQDSPVYSSTFQACVNPVICNDMLPYGCMMTLELTSGKCFVGQTVA